MMKNVPNFYKKLPKQSPSQKGQNIYNKSQFEVQDKIKPLLKPYNTYNKILGKDVTNLLRQKTRKCHLFFGLLHLSKTIAIDLQIGKKLATLTWLDTLFKGQKIFHLKNSLPS